MRALSFQEKWHRMDKDYLAKVLACLLAGILILLVAASEVECYDMPMMFCNHLFPSCLLYTSITGVPLPLISYSGSFVLMVMFALGLVNSCLLYTSRCV